MKSNKKTPTNCILNRNEKTPHQNLNEPDKIVILHVLIYILLLKNATKYYIKI